MARIEDIPKGFVSLLEASARLGEPLSVIGVVTDSMPAAKSRGSDYMCKFTLYDPSSGDFDVKFFRPSFDELPQVSVGDVVVIYSIKVTIYRGVRIALSSHQTTWTVFAALDIPSKSSSGTTKIRHTSSAGARPPAAAVSLYAISLCNARGRPADVARVEPTNRAIAREAAPEPVPVVSASKACLIKDVKEKVFCDVVGQVVKIFPGDRGTLEIYITDYTSHQLLFNYERDGSNAAGGVSRDGDAYGYVPSKRVNRSWPGPYGQMTLQVTLWPPHSDHAHEHLKVGDNVYLRNLTIKRVRESLLAAVLHTNRIRPDRIDVHVIDDPSDSRVKDLLVRKRAYWKKIEKDRKKSLKVAKDPAKNPDASKPKNQQKRQREADESSSEEEGKEVRAKKAKHKGRKSANRKAEALPEAQPKPPQHNGVTDLNKHIRCNHPAKRPIPIAEILSGNGHEVTSPKGVNYALPFHNVCCRTRARVVDFFPHDLADFAVPCKQSEYDVLTDSSGSGGGSDTDDTHSGWPAPQDSEAAGPIRWEWRFCLLLEDGWAKPGSADGTDKDKLQVLVAQEDAEYLLKLTAEDLRKNPTALATLKERLFILWGDLEERKAAARALRDNPQPQRKQSNPVEGGGRPSGGGDGNKSGGVSSGKAFECCLREYGVRVPKQKQKEGSEKNDTSSFGWDRKFRMFGTTIM